MKKNPRFLLTNDDGINSRGIRIFAGMLKEFGEVTVVAPACAQSGMSAALSLEQPLYLKHAGCAGGIDWWSFTGTPVSCVKAGLNDFFHYTENDMPDFVFSGVNIGSNCSVASIYSGTLGACAEGTLYGVPSVGFSICTHDEECDMSAVEVYGRKILSKLLDGTYTITPGTYLNVNFPDLPASSVKGITTARRGRGRWIKEYAKRNNEEFGEHLWMSGSFEDLEPECGDGDHRLALEGYITVVPLLVDTTDYNERKIIEEKWCDLITPR